MFIKPSEGNENYNIQNQEVHAPITQEEAITEKVEKVKKSALKTGESDFSKKVKFKEGTPIESLALYNPKDETDPTELIDEMYWESYLAPREENVRKEQGVGQQFLTLYPMSFAKNIEKKIPDSLNEVQAFISHLFQEEISKIVAAPSPTMKENVERFFQGIAEYLIIDESTTDEQKEAFIEEFNRQENDFWKAFENHILSRYVIDLITEYEANEDPKLTKLDPNLKKYVTSKMNGFLYLAYEQRGMTPDEMQELLVESLDQDIELADNVIQELKEESKTRNLTASEWRQINSSKAFLEKIISKKAFLEKFPEEAEKKVSEEAEQKVTEEAKQEVTGRDTL